MALVEPKANLSVTQFSTTVKRGKENMTKAMKVYEEVKSKLGAEEQVTKTITKREFKEDGWEYTFLFFNGKLAKVEAYNHRELIEVYNR